MTDELINLHGSEEKLMPFLHLPIQSGSNKILKLMNRRHDRDYYLEIIRKIRKSRPDIVLSSDFIVGFPSETDEDFADTLNLVKEVGYGQCYSFKYSPRPGTPAAGKEQVQEEVKTERLAILQEEINRQQFEFNKSCEGKILSVLFDRDAKFDNQILGKTVYMQSVHVAKLEDNLYGKICNVKITKALPTSLSGEVVN
jgi:tRNA-2-methylthio-N6-dimethylallyladenosine synthase